MKKIKLFFIPHAGGSAMGYMRLKRFLAEDYIEAVPLELAGRGQRIREKCFTDVEECVKDLFTKIREETIDCEYAIFGHSVGALITYELAQYIKKCNYKSPLCIFLSGRKAANSKVSEDNLTLMNDEELFQQFDKLKALPKELKENKEILSLMMPILRADVKMSEYYRFEDKGLLECNIFGFYSNKDSLVNKEEMEAWQDLTSKKCEVTCFNGGHFYIDDNREVVAGKINSILMNF